MLRLPLSAGRYVNVNPVDPGSVCTTTLPVPVSPVETTNAPPLPPSSIVIVSPENCAFAAPAVTAKGDDADCTVPVAGPLTSKLAPAAPYPARMKLSRLLIFP